ncbi:MAG TPA: hypothetical protein DDW31_08470 [candidate division Zixibacteria bacterium]|nr:hypothetical protein [candidate division Zixibacteria bacterium]
MKKAGFLFILAFGLIGWAQAQKLTVSVMDLNVTEGLSAKEVMMLTDKLLNEFVSQGVYKVIERSKRDEILKEQGFQQSGACDATSCLVEAGQYLGVQKMFGGTIGRFGAVFAVELRMIDVKTGEIDLAFSKKYTGDVSNLLDAMKEAAVSFTYRKSEPSPSPDNKRKAIKFDLPQELSAEYYKNVRELDEYLCTLQTDSLTKRNIRRESIAEWLTERGIKVEKSEIENEKSLIYIKTNENGYKEFRNEKDGSILIEIPEGSFFMGANDGEENEKPIHSVYLVKYFIGKYEVTVSQFSEFVKATGYKADNDDSYEEHIKHGYSTEFCNPWYKPKYQQSENYPVVNISWNDAKAYCDWAGLRLPTEAEWEKAARGKDKRKYPWGNKWNNTKCNSGSKDDGFLYASPVGSFKGDLSPYGCYDMAGNVSEWCNDWYDENSYKYFNTNNPKGPERSHNRVTRGGSWADNNTISHIITKRPKIERPGLIRIPSSNLGFRVAR